MHQPSNLSSRISRHGEDVDSLFRRAVALIDSGDAAELEHLLRVHPTLVRDRLDAPGDWLRTSIGDALDGFFDRPWLLWFVAEDPVRNGTLPSNIADVARVIIDAARRERVDSLQEQLDYALSLVCWSPVAPKCGVQIALIDVLVDSGASMTGAPDNALVNGNRDAAAHLIERGASLTLSAAIGLDRHEEASTLAGSASARERQRAFILSALHGNVEGLHAMLAVGVEVNLPSEDLYSHATALHHAVWSGSLPAVEVLVEAGADLEARDSENDGTPLDWAEYAAGLQETSLKSLSYSRIAEYLRSASR